MKKNTNETELALLRQEIQYIHSELDKINKTLKEYDNEHVSYKEFLPIKNVMYGIIGLVLTTVVGAIISLVINHE